MLEVREQAPLSFRRMLDVCIDSISYRLLRSAVTVAIIILAIAFLATIMAEGYLGRAVRDTVMARTIELTAFSRFLRSVSVVGADERLVRGFGGLEEDAAGFRNLSAWGQFAAREDVRSFIATSRDAASYLGFFEAMPVGRRVLLVEDREGAGIFDWLAEPGSLAAFVGRLEPMKSVRLPGGLGRFREFLRQWPAYRSRLEAVKASYAVTVRAIAQHCQPQGVGARLLAAAGQGREKEFFGDLERRGFHVDPGQWPHIVAGARYEKRTNWAFAILRRAPVRNAWNRQFQEKFSPGTALKSLADSPSRIAWLEDTLREKSLAEGLDRGRLLAIAKDYKLRTGLLDAEQRLLNRYGRSGGLGEKTIWLIIVSFLVCVVGIANAMLMSVLERFKEIATMKCLGARKGTIGFLFVTESTIVGVVGGIIGMVVGVAIVLARHGIQYGGLLFANLPVGDLLWTFLVCFSCSLILTAVAAIYPARVAARMAPMEAMRVD